MVQRIGTTDSATPHPDPCGGQAPALHFLIPPSTIGLQFGAFRRRRAGMEGDWRALFRTNDGPTGGIRHRGHNRSRLSQIRARDILSQCCCTEALQGKGAGGRTRVDAALPPAHLRCGLREARTCRWT